MQLSQQLQALGGKMIEKHFILDKELGGPDSEFSLDPRAFAEMVTQVRLAEKALGIVTYELDEKVKKNRKFARSLFVIKDIKAGEMITEDNVRSIRPGYGIHPKFYSEILGKMSKINISRGTPFSLAFIDTK